MLSGVKLCERKHLTPLHLPYRNLDKKIKLVLICTRQLATYTFCKWPPFRDYDWKDSWRPSCSGQYDRREGKTWWQCWTCASDWTSQASSSLEVTSRRGRALLFVLWAMYNFIQKMYKIRNESQLNWLSFEMKLPQLAESKSHFVKMILAKNVNTSRSAIYEPWKKVFSTKNIFNKINFGRSLHFLFNCILLLCTNVDVDSKKDNIHQD